MLSDTLKELRTQKGLTQAQLVEKIKENYGVAIPIQSYSTYENGREPSFAVLCAIAKFYSVTTDYLLGLTDVKSPNTDDIAIHLITGLSEKAIHILKECYSSQKKNWITLTVNTLLENGAVLGAISEYLYFDLIDSVYGKVAPYRLKYRYLDSSGFWGDRKPTIFDAASSTEAIDSDMSNRISMLNVQEQLTELLKHEKQVEHFSDE